MARQPRPMRGALKRGCMQDTCVPDLPALGGLSVCSDAILLTAGQRASSSHLEVPGHQNGHDGQAAQAHPQRARVELPARALVGRARRAQVGNGGAISVVAVADRRCVGDVVGVELGFCRAPTWRSMHPFRQVHITLSMSCFLEAGLQKSHQGRPVAERECRK